MGFTALSVRAWGDFACFTRPEMKVERVTYPVMTPSAARGLLEAIFWKPEFSWRVLRIAVLRPIRHFSILRNETTRKLAPGNIAAWMAAGKHDPFLVDEARTQRNALVLRDVAYRIDASIHLRGPTTNGEMMKYRAQFERRVERGQCYTRPCLGCREFAADFGPVDDTEAPAPITEELGQMLFDLRYDGEAGRADPLFFPACISSGVLEVPQALYEEAAL